MLLWKDTTATNAGPYHHKLCATRLVELLQPTWWFLLTTFRTGQRRRPNGPVRLLRCRCMISAVPQAVARMILAPHVFSGRCDPPRSPEADDGPRAARQVEAGGVALAGAVHGRRRRRADARRPIKPGKPPSAASVQRVIDFGPSGPRREGNGREPALGPAHPGD